MCKGGLSLPSVMIVVHLSQQFLNKIIKRGVGNNLFFNWLQTIFAEEA